MHTCIFLINFIKYVVLIRLNIKYSKKRLQNETKKDITLKTLNFKLTLFYLVESCINNTVHVNNNLIIFMKKIELP